MSALDLVNAASWCPSVHGGVMRHAPRISPSGTPVTMRYVDQRYGGQQTVILAACCNALLMPPDDDERIETVPRNGIAALTSIVGRPRHLALN